MLLTLLLVLETLSVQDLIGIVIVTVGGIVGLRIGILKALGTGSKELIELRTTQRDEALSEVRELKEENRLLRRDVMQRIAISLQDVQTLSEKK